MKYAATFGRGPDETTIVFRVEDFQHMAPHNIAINVVAHAATQLSCAFDDLRLKAFWRPGLENASTHRFE